MGNYVRIIAVQFGGVPMNELLLDGWIRNVFSGKRVKRKCVNYTPGHAQCSHYRLLYAFLLL